MSAKVHIVFYSMYGHVYRLAEAIAAGAAEGGASVGIFQVRETLPDDVLAKMHATDAKKPFAHLPFAQPDTLVEPDAIIFGTPTRYGLPCAQMQTFLDSTGQLWQRGALIGKIGSVFTSTASQHGGQETTIVHMHSFLLHQGMLVSGVPYAAPELLNLSEISGGSPYGASTIAGPMGERQPSVNELAIARFQGRHVAQLAARLAAK